MPPRPRPRARSAALAPPTPPEPGPYARRPWLDAYPIDVPPEYEFPVVPVTRLLDDAASSFPNTPALAYAGSTTSYLELRNAVDAAASGLAGLGVGRGDRVSLLLPNCPQHVVTLFAVWRLGAVAAEHNPLSYMARLRGELQSAGSRVVVCIDQAYGTVAGVRGETHVESVVVTSLGEHLSTGRRRSIRLPSRLAPGRAGTRVDLPRDPGLVPFGQLTRPGDKPVRQAVVDPATELALLCYADASAVGPRATGPRATGPRATMLSHANLVAAAYQSRLWLPEARVGRDVTLGVVPLFDAYGITAALTTSMLLGGTLLLLPRFDLDEVVSTLETYRPSLFPGVAAMYRALADSPSVAPEALRSLKSSLCSRIRMPVESAERYDAKAHGTLIQGYALSETSAAALANPVHGTRKPGTAGLPLPGTTCRIVDPENAEIDAPLGQPGELLVAGPQVFRGYWQDEAATSAAFAPDGSLRTGDIAVMDGEGYVRVLDPYDELIRVGGGVVYPSEVEEVVHRLPGVADCCVAGAAVRGGGELVKAYVIRRRDAPLTEDDVLGHARAHLPPYLVPAAVEFRDSLPRTLLGAVNRRALVEQDAATARLRDRAEAGTVALLSLLTDGAPAPAPRPAATPTATPTTGPTPRRRTVARTSRR